jgi:hypothetical protein
MIGAFELLVLVAAVGTCAKIVDSALSSPRLVPVRISKPRRAPLR